MDVHKQRKVHCDGVAVVYSYSTALTVKSVMTSNHRRAARRLLKTNFYLWLALYYVDTTAL